MADTACSAVQGGFFSSSAYVEGEKPALGSSRGQEADTKGFADEALRVGLAVRPLGNIVALRDLQDQSEMALDPQRSCSCRSH